MTQPSHPSAPLDDAQSAAAGTENQQSPATLQANAPAASPRRPIDSIAILFPLILGILYTFGFLIVNLHAWKYQRLSFDLDLLKARYLSTGLLFLVLTVPAFSIGLASQVYVAVKALRRRASLPDKQRNTRVDLSALDVHRERPFLTFLGIGTGLGLFWFMIFAGFAVPSPLLWPFSNLHRDSGLWYYIIMVGSGALFFHVHWRILADTQSAFESGQALIVYGMKAMELLVLLLGSVSMYANFVYGRLDPAYGGGAIPTGWIVISPDYVRNLASPGDTARASGPWLNHLVGLVGKDDQFLSVLVCEPRPFRGFPNTVTVMAIPLDEVKLVRAAGVLAPLTRSACDVSPLVDDLNARMRDPGMPDSTARPSPPPVK